jgi:hypothetical protein
MKYYLLDFVKFFFPNNQLNNFYIIVALMRRLFSVFPHYFTDNSAVKYLLIKYFIHQCRVIIPTIARMWQKYE